jgi:hypothetical protein
MSGSLLRAAAAAAREGRKDDDNEYVIEKGISFFGRAKSKSQ